MSSSEQQYDVTEILRLLPHRYPFVLVDRILSFEAGNKIVALKNVSINEPFFQGHFPIEPVMPGVLVLEGMAQTAALLAYLTEKDMVGKKLVYFAGLDGVRFRQKVVPGDQLHFDVKAVKRKLKLWILEAKAYVDENLVAEAQLMATFS